MYSHTNEEKLLRRIEDARVVPDVAGADANEALIAQQQNTLSHMGALVVPAEAVQFNNMTQGVSSHEHPRYF